MRIHVEPGKYIAAVSGGVDSIVLLDLLSKLPGVLLVVAHFDHGIRGDSFKDLAFVKEAAERYELPFESAEGRLGAKAGEAAARTARYGFLESVKRKYDARAVITAHHQDDMIETALINLLRGTGRRGLFSISANKKVIRPLLNYRKTQIIEYAKKHDIKWREDPTNLQDEYLRNYVRHNLIPGLSEEQRLMIVKNADKLEKIDGLIQAELSGVGKNIITDGWIDRSRFSALPTEIGSELLLNEFRQLRINDIDRKTVNRINMAIRTSGTNEIHPIKKGMDLKITATTAIITSEA